MKVFFAFSFLALLVTLGLPVQSHAEEMAAKPKLVAFHSDNCGSCKVLGPKLMEALNDTSAEVEFVKFDYTDRTTIEKSKMLASEKGLTDLQKKHGAKTGFALLVSSDGSVAKKFTRGSDESDILAALNAAH